MSVNDQTESNVEDCDIFQSVNIIGGRYKLLVLRALLERGQPLRFGVLSRQVPGVSQKTLTRTLRELEGSGLVHRQIFGEVPPRVEYSLTVAGSALMPIFAQIRQWRMAHPKISA